MFIVSGSIRRRLRRAQRLSQVLDISRSTNLRPAAVCRLRINCWSNRRLLWIRSWPNLPSTSLQFSVSVRVLWKLQGCCWASVETLQRDFLASSVSLSVLAPVVSKIIKSELRSRLRRLFFLATSAMLHVCPCWHFSDVGDQADGVGSSG